MLEHLFENYKYLPAYILITWRLKGINCEES
jgi:hypothetical protein